MKLRAPDPSSPLFLAFGFLLWSSAFATLYAAQSAGCELGLDRSRLGPLNLLRIVLIVLWACHMAALAWLCYACLKPATRNGVARSSTGRFFRTAALGATGAALAATLWIGLAIPFASMCV